MTARPSSTKQVVTTALLAAVAVAAFHCVPELRRVLREPWYQRWLFPLLWGAAFPFALLAAWGTVAGLVRLVEQAQHAPASAFDHLGMWFMVGMMFGLLLSLSSSRR